MKNGLSLVLLVVSALAAFDCFGQQEITVTATAANTVASRTSIDLPGLANNPNAIIVATPLGTTNPNPIGAWYYNNNWNIFNITHATMPIGSKFKVEVFLTPGANQFLHIINTSNLVGGISFIDNPGLNNKPNAQLKILQKHATGYNLNSFEATAQYDQIAKKWYIKNVNGNPLILNTAYNVVITTFVPTIVLPALLEGSIPNFQNQPTTPTGNAGGDLSGNYPNPKVVGLNGKPISNKTPVVGDMLRWNGTAWEPYTPAGNAIVNANQLVGRDIVTTAPTEGQVLKFSGGSWHPADDIVASPVPNVASPVPVAKPSVVYFIQSDNVNMYDPNVNTQPIAGLDNQTFTLAQSSRIVFQTVIEAQTFGLFQANNTGISLRVEILNSSNGAVAWSSSSGVLFFDVLQTINSTGIGVLPPGDYHTKVTFNRQAGGAKLDVLRAGFTSRQGGQMIIQIFPD